MNFAKHSNLEGQHAFLIILLTEVRLGISGNIRPALIPVG